MTKDDIKILLMCIVASVTYGLAGVGAILLMTLLSSFALGRDAAAKHGISTTESSRLGGLAIFLVVVVYLGGLTLFSHYTPGVVREERELWFWSVVFICTCLGLAEDIKPDFLTPAVRLLLKFAVLGGLLWVWPTFIPQQIGISIVDWMLAIPVLAWLLGTIFYVGFINAFNMADGANGLVPGIATVCFAIFFLEYGRPSDGVLMFACTIFLIFNLISGWFFLGDAGSYGLGSIIAGYGLYGVSTGQFSAGFMAALLAYPCLDLVISVSRRLLQGRSPFSPDNDHLHNRIHSQLRNRLRSKVLANSLTGLSISMATSGLVLIGYVNNRLPADSNDWLFVFIAQSLAYGGVFYLTGRGRPLTEAQTQAQA
ncbi:undecaprenyl/decaprenyl-phosphate alpha-N-acetylglucosaminyl 1-phosphate transferase [Porticoccaceae bacterium]|nr:undecaprenyl/decaprenyl-phosphate alpha-N-acetylglucosaminyl 1-phosphate transferase [Porticoccaceae bacterium]